MNIKILLLSSAFMLFFHCSQLFSQSRRASQYLDLVPAPPKTLAEAKSRLSSNDEDTKAAAVLRQIAAESDTVQPLTIDDTSSSRNGHVLSAQPAVDYTSIKKSVETEWNRMDESFMNLVQNPKFTFQNTVITIGEDRVKALAACRHSRHKKGMTRQRQDSICAARAEADAMKKRDVAAVYYLNVMEKNWTEYISLVKSYLVRQEAKMDSVRVKSVEASTDIQARKVEATLSSVVKIVLQNESDITKAVVEAGAR
jgi:hypothetical protein